jgi:hypothetical protein
MHPEIVHRYSERHVLTLWDIQDMMHAENRIIPWEYNRPVDMLRVEEIVAFIARKHTMDWALYMIYDSKTRTYKVVDGNHRYHAIRAFIERNPEIDSHQKIAVSILVDPTFGETTDWFQALNKSNPVPELYTEDKRNGDKRQVVEGVLREVQEKWKSHFSSCLKPHVPNINRDRFIDVLNILYEKYARSNRSSARDILVDKLDQKNAWVRENILTMKKIPKKALEKCEETGCYLFLLKSEWIEE